MMKWVDSPWFVVAVLVFGAVFILLAATMSRGEDPPPYGCAWVDMNPSKGSDYKLACVKGYFPDDQVDR